MLPKPVDPVRLPVDAHALRVPSTSRGRPLVLQHRAGRHPGQRGRESDGRAMIGDQFTEPPDMSVWMFVECPDECHEPHPFMRTGERCSRGHEIDPCEGCAAWGEGCGAIYQLRAAAKAMGT